MPVNVSAYQSIQATLVDQGVTLIAVSKTKPKEELMELYALGQLSDVAKTQELLITSGLL